MKINDRERNARQQFLEKADINEKLYHYTSMDALYGMIKNKEFWWGSLAEMNDTRELKYFIDDLKTKLKVGNEEDEQTRYDAVFSIIDTKLQNGAYQYAMCFSHLEDDAAQWERYADNAKGVRIAFNLKKLRELFYRSLVVPGNVYYGYDVREHEHYTYLQEYIRSGNQTQFSTIEGWASNILITAASYKHKSFQSENEYRFTTLNDSPNISGATIEHKLKGGIIKKTLVVNYEKLCETEGLCYEDLFDEILIGTRSNQRIADLSRFLDECGFPKLKDQINRSQCPLSNYY